VPASESAQAVERARELASSADRGLLEVTMSGGACRARVVPATEQAAPPAAV
jgi:hypothetical protein